MFRFKMKTLEFQPNGSVVHLDIVTVRRHPLPSYLQSNIVPVNHDTIKQKKFDIQK